MPDQPDEPQRWRRPAITLGIIAIAIALLLLIRHDFAMRAVRAPFAPAAASDDGHQPDIYVPFTQYNKNGTAVCEVGNIRLVIRGGLVDTVKLLCSGRGSMSGPLPITPTGGGIYEWKSTRFHAKEEGGSTVCMIDDVPFTITDGMLTIAGVTVDVRGPRRAVLVTHRAQVIDLP
jgi:hypothetical protein